MCIRDSSGSKDMTFGDREVRLGFIRKVYTILSLMLSITFLFVYFTYASVKFQVFLKANPGIFIAAAVINIICFYMVMCYTPCARAVPINYILLTIITISQSYIVAYVCARYTLETVLIAAGLTAAITVALTIYACTTKTDFTYCGGLLFMFGCVLLVGGLFAFIFKSATARIVICCLCVILYGLYLIYDTQLVVGGGRVELSVDDYVVGALILYVDIIQLFLKILEILGKK
eukprot:TRINITY_DN7341_c0_g2_i2.p1 TRINITY_DN7341_c0_g2~~TRINITY_DN7341_c0_g2_i2.p1  ORF type:complete len:260 (-),score=74.20 TRINITY_DN7341_c0_g2_i2:152-847(-)